MPNEKLQRKALCKVALDKLVSKLSKEREAKYDAKKEAEEAKARATNLGNLEKLKKKWIQKGIDQCTYDVVGLLDRVYQAGYDFPFHKMGMPSDHELRVVVERPDSLSLEDADQVDGANPPPVSQLC